MNCLATTTVKSESCVKLSGNACSRTNQVTHEAGIVGQERLRKKGWKNILQVECVEDWEEKGT